MTESTTTAPYFKFDAGQFTAETMGYPNAVVGLYVRALALYWESGCKLPDDGILHMKLGIRTKKDREQLAMILGTFFNEHRRHPRLDQCSNEVRLRNQQQRDRANKRWAEEKRRKAEEQDGDF